MSFNAIDKLAKLHVSHKTMTDIEKDIILDKYPPIGKNQNEWIDWVIDIRKRDKCPYRQQ